MPDKVGLKAPDRICIVSDLHCGSFHGVVPRRWLPNDLSTIQVPAQLGLIDRWEHFVENDPGGDLLLLGGDLIDGKQIKDKGKGLWTADLMLQTKMACEVLAPLRSKYRKCIRSWGTPYHEGDEGVMSYLDKVLGVDYSAQVIDIRCDVEGEEKPVTINLAHHPPGGAVLYLGTKLNRTILWTILQIALGRFRDCDWIVRAHLHEGGMMRLWGKTAVQLPCWKLADPWAIKRNRESWQPTIGSIYLERYEHATGKYVVIEQSYTHPSKQESPLIDGCIDPESKPYEVPSPDDWDSGIYFEDHLCDDHLCEDDESVGGVQPGDDIPYTGL